MKRSLTRRALAALLAVLLVVSTAGCDFRVFRSAFGDVAYSFRGFSGAEPVAVHLDESGASADEAASMWSDFITGTAGDLNGDGILDGVAVLATNTGGTGVFYTVHAILGDGGGGRQDVASVFLGDRIAVTGVAVTGTTVEVSMLHRGEDEPFIAEPTIGVLLRLILEDGALIEAPPAG